MNLWARLRNLVVNRILGLEDSPQRIARGVFLGFVVGMTPTIGLQIVLYLGLATLLRANKVAGVPITFIANPLSALPLYGFCWWVGNLLLHGGHGESSWDAVSARLTAELQSSESVYDQLLSADFWRRMGGMMGQLGGELWLGSLVLGFAVGLPAYALVLWGVGEYRRRVPEAVNLEPDASVSEATNERTPPPQQ